MKFNRIHQTSNGDSFSFSFFFIFNRSVLKLKSCLKKIMLEKDKRNQEHATLQISFSSSMSSCETTL